MPGPALRTLCTFVLPLVVAGSLAAQNAGLDWLRFVGGPGDDVVGFPNGIDVTANGDIWLAGADSAGVLGNVQITRLDAAGTVLSSWSFGGAAHDRASAIKVAGGLVHVAGRTQSLDFPVTTDAVQQQNAGGRDMFYTVLDQLTGSILYSTLLGGSGDDVATDLDIDPAGGVWVYGATLSTDFPTTPNAFQANLRGASDLALARIDRTRSGAAGLVYSTLFGGDGNEPSDNVSDLVVETSGVVTFFADTSSTNLPVTANAWQPAFGGGPCDALIARLDTRQLGSAQLVYSTYAGGNDFDNGNAMWVEGDVVTIAGATRSTDLRTRKAPQPTRAGLYDAYVLQLDMARPSVKQQLFGTYLGGSRTDVANGVTVDAAGCITITGATAGLFPTTLGAYLETLNPVPSTPAASHAFVARLDPIAGSVLYSTYIGTDNPFGNTTATALRPDGLGGVIVVGRTDAASLPVTMGPPLAGTFDAWLATLPLLPRGAVRHGDSSWATGRARAFLGVTAMPRTGDATFAMINSGVPGTSLSGCGSPSAVLLVAQQPHLVGLPILGVVLHLTPPIVLSTPTAPGRSYMPMSLAGIPRDAQASFQVAYLHSSCGLLQLSNALELVVQQ